MVGRAPRIREGRIAVDTSFTEDHEPRRRYRTDNLKGSDLNMEEKTGPTILVAEDDQRMQRLIRRNLELAGFEVILAADGHTALRMAEVEQPDLVLLDIMMPGMDGFTVCSRLRETSVVPIIMLTARDADADIVRGLAEGADDYVTKPFSVDELIARVKAVLRRSAMAVERPDMVFHCNDMAIDFSRRRVTVRGREVVLSATEYKLLAHLARNPGRVVTTAELLHKIWGNEYIGENHLLRVNVARLREKLGDDPMQPRYIATKRGIGYLMAHSVQETAGVH